MPHRTLTLASALLLTVLTLLTLHTAAHAQLASEGPVVIGYELHARARTADLPDRPGVPDAASAQVQLFTVSGGAPVVHRRGRLLVMPVVSYLRLDPDVARVDGQPTVDTLHATMITVVSRYAITDDWAVVGLLGGGFATDFQGVWLDDYVISGALMGSYRINQDLSLGAGVGYDRRTGELRPLPLVQLDWHFTPDLRLSGVIPARVYLGWRAAERLTVGLRGGLEGERFNLDADPFGVEDVELAWSVVKVAPSVVLHLGPVHLDLHAGLATQRRFEVFVDDVARGDGGLESTWFVGARLWLGLSGWRRDRSGRAASPTPASDG